MQEKNGVFGWANWFFDWETPKEGGVFRCFGCGKSWAMKLWANHLDPTWKSDRVDGATKTQCLGFGGLFWMAGMGQKSLVRH